MDVAFIRTTQAAKAIVEHLNYRVLTAYDGREAREIFDAREMEIALVITDVVMPEVGGVELFEGLKAKGSAVPVIMITGYPLGENILSQMPEGVAGYLQKPLSLGDVSNAIAEALDCQGTGL